jgi:two-component system, sensor histidine kinase PdtaS
MEKLLAWLPEKPQPLIVRYGITAITVAICFALLRLVQARSGVDSFFLMYPAVFLGALLFDRGSGFLATILSTALIVASLPREAGAIIPAPYWLPLTLFLLIGLALAALSETLRKGWERALEAERAKDLLYRELRHRTKNDFAMAVSVLNLQARAQTKPEVHQALAEAASRLHVLSKAHEQLEPRGDRAAVQMSEYLHVLCQSLTESMGPEKAAVRVECDDTELPVERAIPVGLIVNELVTNAFKHAFVAEHKGEVFVALRHGKNYRLSVADNGKGCPKSAASGLGSQLVELLVRQLEGSLERTEATPGCRVQIEFPEAARPL